MTSEECINGLLRSLTALEQTDFKFQFDTLKFIVHHMAEEKGWWNPAKSFGEQIVMMYSELSEAIEEYRVVDGDITKIYYNEDGKPEGVPIELGDCIIRILDTAERYDIDILAAIVEKIKFNSTRPERHGDKKL